MHMVVRDKMVDMLVTVNEIKYLKHVHITKKGGKYYIRSLEKHCTDV